MTDALTRTLGDEVQRRLASGEWEVIALSGGRGNPPEVRRWCAETFGTEAPILVVIEAADVAVVSTMREQP